MSRACLRFGAAGLLLMAALVPLSARPPQDPPSPEEHFGYRMGAEGRLADWNAMLAYFGALDRWSDRVRLDDIGPTTEGRRYVTVTIASPEALARLPDLRQVQRQLADPRSTPPEVAERLAASEPAVVVVSAGVHSNEIGGMQMMPELAHHLATDPSPATARLLDELVVVLVPSQNPDGLQMTVEWHDRNAGTPFEDAPLPELYHPYAGHDNNRDAYMQTLVETRLLGRLLYRDWRPEVYLDLHQMGSTRARVFVPPYKSPANPNVDPLVWSQVNVLGQTMAAALQASGRTGVMWGETYSGYWQGANSSTPWWHNMVGILSEVAGARLSSAIVQDGARPVPGSLGTRPPRGEAPSGAPTLPAPSDTQFRMTYPEPWLGGAWTPRDVVEYHFVATMGLLQGVANNRALLKRNAYRMHQRTIEHFERHGPYAFVVPARQRDPAAAARLVRTLQAGGAEVDRVAAATVAGDVVVDAGSYVVRLAQPYGRWIKDLLERQVYPQSPPGEPVRPYDVSAWTLGKLLGVEVLEVADHFAATLEPLPEPAGTPPGEVTGAGDVMVLSRERANSASAVNGWLRAGARVAWSPSTMTVDGTSIPAGSFVVSGVSPEEMALDVRRLGLRATAIGSWPDLAPLVTIEPPRVAVLEPWGGAIDAGWTRWVLEQYEFTYERLRPPQVATTLSASAFDVILIPEVTSLELVRGLQGAHVRPEHRGGLGEAGIAALKRFLRDGGTIVTLGNAASFAIDFLDVPVAVTARADDPNGVFAPGSLLRIHLRADHPLTYGLPGGVDAMVVRNAAYAPARGGDHVVVAGRYAPEALLQSGVLAGEGRLHDQAALLDVRMGRGRVIILGPRVQHRGQTQGTFQLLFNAIYYGASSRLMPAEETEQ